MTPTFDSYITVSLQGATFVGAKFLGCNFNLILEKVDFSAAFMIVVDFMESRLIDTRFTGARFSRVHMIATAMSGEIEMVGVEFTDEATSLPEIINVEHDRDSSAGCNSRPAPSMAYKSGSACPGREPSCEACPE